MGWAHRGDPFSQPSGSSAFLADALAGLIRTERSGPDVSCPAPSGSVFLVNRSITTRVGFGKRVRSPALRPSRHRRDQKTFSAGPRSFNSKELWFPGSIPASGVQPVSDSRHGRITCKAYLSCVKIKGKESRRLQSNHRALGPTPFLAGGGSQKFNSFSSACLPVPGTCVSRHSRTVRP